MALIKSGRSLTMKVKHMHGRQTDIRHRFKCTGSILALIKSGRSLTMKVKHMHGRQTDIRH